MTNLKGVAPFFRGYSGYKSRCIATLGKCPYFGLKVIKIFYKKFAFLDSTSRLEIHISSSPDDRSNSCLETTR